MTLHLNFSEKANQEQLQILGIWLKEMGLVKSFKISDLTLEDINPEGETNTDSFVENMLRESNADIENGRVYTSEEAKELVQKWLKQQQ